MLIAATMTLGDVGPVVTELECSDGTYRSVAHEFDEDEDAITYWGRLNTNGDLIHDEGRVFIGEKVVGLVLDMDLDPDGVGRLTLMFDQDPEAQITIIESTTFVWDVALGFLGNIPRAHRETHEQAVNRAGIA